MLLQKFKNAVLSDDILVVALSLQAGIDLTKSYDVLDQHTPLSYVVCHGYNSVEMFMMLIEHGADINQLDAKGCGPLHYAISHCEVGILETLFSLDVDLTLCDKYGESPLHWAVLFQGIHTDMVLQRLLLSDIDVNAKNSKGYTPLHHASEYGLNNVAEMLIAHGANVNAQDTCNRTPLHFACDGQNEDLVKILMSQNIDVHLPDIWGETAVDAARRVSSDDILTILGETKKEDPIFA